MRLASRLRAREARAAARGAPALLCALVALAGCLGRIERPAAGDDAERAQHTESLARSVEQIARGYTNFGRLAALRRRARELELGELRSEWIDWFSLQQNVWLEIPGSTPALVYVVAHYDKVDLSPLSFASVLVNGLLDPLIAPTYLGAGAADNGTGVALALELARALRARPGRYTYRILWVGSEEAGLRGSRAHVARLSPAEKEAIALAVVIDSAGLRFSEDCVMSVSDRAAAELALGAARSLGLKLGEGRLPRGASSDYEPFQSHSAALDVLRGLKFNLIGGLLPQRSWFSGPHRAPVLFLSACNLLSGRDPGNRLSALVPIPLAALHGPRDRLAVVSAARLHDLYAIALRALQDLEAGQPLVE
jgi:hypothetical protein